MANQEVSGRKVVYIVGPSSTGKTTLCTALSEVLNLSETAYVTEVARKVLKERGYTRNDVHRLEMQRDIMLAHIQSERLARDSEESPGLILCDRSAIDAIVYAILTAGDDRNANDRRDQLIRMDEFQDILPSYRQSLFFLLEPVEEWIVDDGVRSIDNIWDCFETFQATLRYLGIEYRVISKENKLIADRVAIVTKLVGS
ncbi:AAA domain-containing protein [Amanita rubescens]|nr:AAA domain-containing protein [Amanita rubescens]